MVHIATGATAAFGAAALAWPLVAHLKPAFGTTLYQPIEVDLSDLKEGNSLKSCGSENRFSSGTEPRGTLF